VQLLALLGLKKIIVVSGNPTDPKNFMEFLYIAAEIWTGL